MKRKRGFYIKMAYTEIKPNAEQDRIIKDQAHEAIESGYEKALAHYK